MATVAALQARVAVLEAGQKRPRTQYDSDPQITGKCQHKEPPAGQQMWPAYPKPFYTVNRARVPIPDEFLPPCSGDINVWLRRPGTNGSASTTIEADAS